MGELLHARARVLLVHALPHSTPIKTSSTTHRLMAEQHQRQQHPQQGHCPALRGPVHQVPLRPVEDAQLLEPAFGLHFMGQAIGAGNLKLNFLLFFIKAEIGPGAFYPQLNQPDSSASFKSLCRKPTTS